jgi:hypothetical protein
MLNDLPPIRYPLSIAISLDTAGTVGYNQINEKTDDLLVAGHSAELLEFAVPRALFLYSLNLD